MVLSLEYEWKVHFLRAPGRGVLQEPGLYWNVQLSGFSGKVSSMEQWCFPNIPGLALDTAPMILQTIDNFKP